MTTYIIYLSYPSAMNNGIDSLAMVFHIQPVSYIRSVAIHRQGFTLQDILDDQWDQLLREMIRAIIIRTAGDTYGHFIGIGIGFYKQVGAGLGSTIRTSRVQRGSFVEISLCSQTAIHLIGRYLMETDSFPPLRIAGFVFSCHPGSAGSIEQVLCSQDVGYEK